MTSMWSQFNSQGSLTLAHLDRQHARLELTGIPEPHALFCVRDEYRPSEGEGTKRPGA